MLSRLQSRLERSQRTSWINVSSHELFESNGFLLPYFNQKVLTIYMNNVLAVLRSLTGSKPSFRKQEIANLKPFQLQGYSLKRPLLWQPPLPEEKERGPGRIRPNVSLFPMCVANRFFNRLT